MFDHVLVKFHIEKKRKGPKSFSYSSASLLELLIRWSLILLGDSLDI